MQFFHRLPDFFARSPSIFSLVGVLGFSRKNDASEQGRDD